MQNARYAVLAAGSGSLRSLPPHRNPGLEIVFIERGHLRWEVDGVVHSILPGSVFFTLPWEQHGSVDEYEPGHRWHFAILRMEGWEKGKRAKLAFAPELNLSAKEAAFILQTLRSARRRSQPAGDWIPWILPHLVEEFQKEDPLSTTASHRLAGLLLVELARSVVQSHVPLRVMAGTESRVRNFLEKLAVAHGAKWTLEGMARQCRLGRTHFAEQVKRITGDAPQVYHNRMRINLARRLLIETKKPITEIAMESGFPSSQHFAKVFLKFTGISASKYRTRHQVW